MDRPFPVLFIPSPERPSGCRFPEKEVQKRSRRVLLSLFLRLILFPDPFQVLFVVENVPDNKQSLQGETEKIHIPGVRADQAQIDAGNERPDEHRSADELQGIRLLLPVAVPQKKRGRGDAPNEDLPDARLFRDPEIDEHGADDEPDLARKEHLRKYRLADLRDRSFGIIAPRVLFRYRRNGHFEHFAQCVYGLKIGDDLALFPP